MRFLRSRRNRGKAGKAGKAEKDEPDTRDLLRDPAGAAESNPLTDRFDPEEERGTVILGERQVTGAEIPDEAKTRIFGRGGPDAPTDPPTDRMDDPPAGWLVVLDGPGKANHLTVRYGVNNIGRGEGQRIRLDFGDERISRENHAMVTYDDKSGRFYVQQGAGPNLTYLRDEPLLTPKELNDGDVISLGDTVLLFKRLCGPDFDWFKTSDPEPGS